MGKRKRRQRSRRKQNNRMQSSRNQRISKGPATSIFSLIFKKVSNLIVLLLSIIGAYSTFQYLPPAIKVEPLSVRSSDSSSWMKIVNNSNFSINNVKVSFQPVATSPLKKKEFTVRRSNAWDHEKTIASKGESTFEMTPYARGTSNRKPVDVIVSYTYFMFGLEDVFRFEPLLGPDKTVSWVVKASRPLEKNSLGIKMIYQPKIQVTDKDVREELLCSYMEKQKKPVGPETTCFVKIKSKKK